MVKTLALNGGAKTIQHHFAPYRSIGQEEVKAAQRVTESGILSAFIGGWTPEFLGGPEVKSFEDAWAKTFEIDHAVSMNSATSCLYAAIGAIGVGPGDEVIVSPYSMCASATAILIYNAIPIFADISRDDFNLDIESVRSKLTTRTKAIIVPNIFGHPAKLFELRSLADQHGLYLIEDNAQAILAKEEGVFTGTIGHIGVFSLNYHKHIHTGEGGICVTNSPELAENLQLLRNHAEAVVGKMGKASLINMIGFNFRMGEIEAAIGKEQLKKAPVLVDQRRKLASRLHDNLRHLPQIIAGETRRNSIHSWYDFPIRLKPELAIDGNRDKIQKALASEGIPISAGYVSPLYLLPMYQELTGYGDKGCPFKCPHYGQNLDYSPGLCPVTESIQNEELLLFPFCVYELNESEIDQIADGFDKVFGQLENIL
jgi:perosamine synthetase